MRIFPNVKAEIKWLAILGVGLLSVVFFLLSHYRSWQFSLHWLLQAAALWVWVCYSAWKRSELNRAAIEAPLLSALGWANRVTLLRGLLIAMAGGFLFHSSLAGFIGWLPGLLYGAAAILDRVDGYVARKTKNATLLGAELDMAFDALGLLVIPVVAFGLGKIHWSYLLLSLAFYIFQTGIAWRRHRGLQVYSLMPSPLRRALAGFQMGFIALVLLPCFHAPQTIICSIAFMIPALLGFAMDWLVVSGRLDPNNHSTQKILNWLADAGHVRLQPALRVLLVVGMFFMIREKDLLLNASPWVFVSLVVGIVMVILGAAGRVGALVILLLLNSLVLATNVTFITVLCSCVWLLLLGMGRFSLWRWDDLWVNRQDGASAS